MASKPVLWVQWNDSSETAFAPPVEYEILEGALFVTTFYNSGGASLQRVFASGKWDGLTLIDDDEGGTVAAANDAQHLRDAINKRRKLGPQAQTVLTVLESAAGPLSTDDVVAQASGMTKKQVADALRRLVNSGHASKPGRGMFEETES